MFKKIMVALLLLNVLVFAEVEIGINLKSLNDSHYSNGKMTLSTEVIINDGRGLTNGPKDWIALYRKNDSNAWSNVLTWDWAKNLKESDLHGDIYSVTKNINLTNGEYEVRYFKNNSFTTYKKSRSFKVK